MHSAYVNVLTAFLIQCESVKFVTVILVLCVYLPTDWVRENPSATCSNNPRGGNLSRHLTCRFCGYLQYFTAILSGINILPKYTLSCVYLIEVQY